MIVAPDGVAYTHQEFFDFYGGEAEWDAAPNTVDGYVHDAAAGEFRQLSADVAAVLARVRSVLRDVGKIVATVAPYKSPLMMAHGDDFRPDLRARG